VITKLDLDDIQGTVVKAYARCGLLVARYVFFHLDVPIDGRNFVNDIAPLVTAGSAWDGCEFPRVTTNIGFTYEGLRHLDIPEVTLHGFPETFSMGMKARREIIGDIGPSHYKFWDPIWNDVGESKQHVHIIITIDGKEETDLETRYLEIKAILAKYSGVKQLVGHRGPGVVAMDYQPAAALIPTPATMGYPGGKEHFGYNDGISTTFFEGCGDEPRMVIGGGKPTGGDPRTEAGWAPLATGEFVLGHPDEACEYPEAPGPPLFAYNGTFITYRKLHQNVGCFNDYLNKEGAKFPGGKEALAAKFAGRWRNGAPLASFPTEASAKAYIAEFAPLQVKMWKNSATPQEKTRFGELFMQLVAFDYSDDLNGSRCPFGSHTRRTNPRSALEFGKTGAFGDVPGALSNRRRIARRGLPYGHVDDPTSDKGEHGVIMMIVNADLSRQFEFTQQQWMNYGNDFGLANDPDPLLGNHGTNESRLAGGRMTIEGDDSTKPPTPPYFCNKMPTLVETRGGDYFFIPSLTCLRMIARGIIDPT
jgi:deferrochelatase/peroxidase EfeB